MNSMLYGALALISAVIGIGSFVYYQRSANTMLFIVFIVFILLALGFGALFMSGRVNKIRYTHHRIVIFLI